MEFKVRVFKAFNGILAFSAGSPHFKLDYLQKYIRKPSTSPQELNEYEYFSGSRRSIAILVVFSILFFARNCVLPSYTTDYLDQLHFEANIKPIEGHHKLYRIDCLASNCTRFTRRNATNDDTKTRLAEELAELPLFTLCWPIASKLYGPIAFINLTNMLFFSCISFAMMLTGTALPLLQLVLSSDHLLIMFVLAPNVTRRVVQDRAKELLEQLLRSYMNYRLVIAKRLGNGRRCMDASFNCLCYMSNRQNFYQDELVKNNLNKQPFQLFNGDPEDFAADCIPCARTNWWRRKLLNSYISVMVVVISITCFTLLLGIYMVNKDLEYKSRIFQEYEQTMNELKCVIWQQDRGLEPAQDARISLNDTLHNWNWAYAVVELFSFGWPFVCLSVFSMAYYSSCSELHLWLNEIHFYLSVGVEFNKQIIHNCRLQEAKLDSMRLVSDREFYNRVCPSFSICALRDRFQRLTHINMLLVWTRLLGKNERATNSRLECQLATQELVMNSIVDNCLDSNSLVETMEKLYIYFRLFVEHVHSYEPAMGLMIFFINLLNYGYVLAGVWYTRRVKDFYKMPALFIGMGWLIANFVIIITSNFHAKAKKLHPFIWSLLAQMSASKDIRIEHLRFLWFRQIQTLDMDGGLALRALNVRVTYVNIIQLMVWSATIIVVALRV